MAPVERVLRSDNLDTEVVRPRDLSPAPDHPRRVPPTFLDLLDIIVGKNPIDRFQVPVELGHDDLLRRHDDACRLLPPGGRADNPGSHVNARSGGVEKVDTTRIPESHPDNARPIGSLGHRLVLGRAGATADLLAIGKPLPKTGLGHLPRLFDAELPWFRVFRVSPGVDQGFGHCSTIDCSARRGRTFASRSDRQELTLFNARTASTGAKATSTVSTSASPTPADWRRIDRQTVWAARTRA